MQTIVSRKDKNMYSASHFRARARQTLGGNIFSSFKPFNSSSGVLDLEDFIVSNILLPVGAIVFILFCTNKFGWGWKNFKEEYY